MNFVFINGSPKAKTSNSSYFLGLLKDYFSKEEKETVCIKEYYTTAVISEADFYTDLANSHAIIFAFPVYVDALPSNFLAFLIKMSEILKTSPCYAKVYAIVNCGFYEGVQTELAIEILRNWCERTHLSFGQAIGIGSGEMLGSLCSMSLEEGPNKSLGIAIQNLGDTILQNASADTLYVVPSYFPRAFFIGAANHFWVKRAKKNKLHKRDLYRKFAIRSRK